MGRSRYGAPAILVVCIGLPIILLLEGCRLVGKLCKPKVPLETNAQTPVE